MTSITLIMTYHDRALTDRSAATLMQIQTDRWGWPEVRRVFGIVPMALKFWKIGHTLQSGEAELSPAAAAGSFALD